MSQTSERHESSGTGLGGRATSRRAPAGFTFAEVLLATLVAGTMLVTATSALTATARTQDQLVGEPVTAFSLAREMHSLALTLPHDTGDGAPASSGSGIALLEDLDGAVFSPPVGAGCGTLAHASGWTQVVAVDTVSLDDPTRVSADPSAEATLLRLSVTVLEGRTDHGTYVWWLNP